MPVVFYQGRRRWRHAREFGELFAEAVREWPWTPRFEHLLVDQSQAAVGEVRGEALGRVAQLALMAAARRRVSQGRAALLMAAQYMGELARSGRIELFGAIVRYVITTQDKQTVREFGEALRRHVPGPGGDMQTYAGAFFLCGTCGICGTGNRDPSQRFDDVVSIYPSLGGD